MNLLQSLRRSGQSIWLDGFERSWVSSGQLQQAIEADELRGVRSNFDALNLAIQAHVYDRDFKTLAQRSSRSVRSDYEYLLVRDLQLAADRLKPVHAQTQGRDGYVQVDLPPDSLFEAETAIAEAQKIWRAVGWSNLLLRIPATQLMLPVIEQLISDHINVNATLVLSSNGYEQVFNSYLMGVERLIQRGESINDFVCFVSVSIDRLNAVTNPFIAESETSFSMVQARILYQHYRQFWQNVDEAFHKEIRWRSLPEGIQPVRLVWDYTTALPESAWHYLQIATPETVMLLEPSTLEQYRAVSLLPVSLANDEADDEAEQPVPSKVLEIDLDKQVDQLINEEMTRSFNTFQRLLDTIEHKQRGY